ASVAFQPVQLQGERPAVQLEGGPAEPGERVGTPGLPAGGDLVTFGLRLLERRQDPGRRVVVEVPRTVEGRPVFRGPGRLRVPVEKLVANIPPSPPGRGGIGPGSD